MEVEVEVEQSRPDNMESITFDEASMERGKSFVTALQELKNLRPQLYSAAEYCEKSYLHSEQKQIVMSVSASWTITAAPGIHMPPTDSNDPNWLGLLRHYSARVLDNLKDYAVRALVNAVDHLGTVACKLTDLLEQQTLDVSTMELKVSCLKQCRVFIDSASNSYVSAYSTAFTVGSLAPTTLSWHLASETKSTLKDSSCALSSSEDPTTSSIASGVFHLVDAEESTRMKSSAVQFQLPSGGHAKSAAMQTFGTARMNTVEGSKALAASRSFDNPSRQEIVRAPVRSKSLISAFFVPRTEVRAAHALAKDVNFKKRHEQVLVIAEDYATLYEVNGKWPGHAVLVPPAPDAQTAHKFGSQGFFNFTSRRPRHLLQILELGYNVMYNDVDIVWLADPFSYLQGKHDVYFTDDMAAVKPLNHSHDLPPPGKKDRTYICSCMIYLRPTSGAKLVLKKWIEELQAQPWSKAKKSNDQPAFNWALNKTAGQVDLYLLPQAAFPTGGLYFKNQTWVQETKGMHAIIHNNYITGFEKKIKRFHDFGLWLVDEHAKESSLGR
ncbi:hypothetical protein RHGRI_019022 [Rhododendron griersonianum]|uniref:Glycosyltransferase n=1 Tax=Rhododendron griersonianum TaxID=479676 RepID=A0AAV6JAW5_9ERIC|nr:hypothetical protein RHGRI_019022 [Rhododendron griersonianum]